MEKNITSLGTLFEDNISDRQKFKFIDDIVEKHDNIYETDKSFGGIYVRMVKSEGDDINNPKVSDFKWAANEHILII